MYLENDTEAKLLEQAVSNAFEDRHPDVKGIQVHKMFIPARAIVGVVSAWMQHHGFDVTIPDDHVRVIALCHTYKYLWDAGCRIPATYAKLV